MQRFGSQPIMGKWTEEGLDQTQAARQNQLYMWDMIINRFFRFMSSSKRDPQRTVHVKNITRKLSWTHDDIDLMMKPHIYLLEEQEDEEGDVYQPISHQMWNTARDVLQVLTDNLTKQGKQVKKPEINAGRTGDIHLIWHTQGKYTLIVIEQRTGNMKWFVRTEDGKDFRGPLDITSPDIVLLQNLH